MSPRTQTSQETKEFLCDSRNADVSFADKSKASYKFDLANHFDSVAQFTHLLDKSGKDQWFLNLTDCLLLLC